MRASETGDALVGDGAVAHEHRDDAGCGEVGDFASLEPELVLQHRGRVLADPWHTRLGTFGHLRQLHGVAGDQDGILAAVDAVQLDDHVAPIEMRIGDDVGRMEARARPPRRPR